MKNIILDFANTIANLSPSNEELISSYLSSQHKIFIEQEALAVAIHIADHSIFYSSVNSTGSIYRKNFYHGYNQCVINLLGLNHIVSPSSLYEYFSSHKRRWKLKEGVLSVIETLASRNFKLYILSNFDSCLQKIVKDDLGISNLFSGILASADCNLEKPDPKFYQHFLQSHKLAIKDSIYVGDNYFLDFIPSRSLGLETYIVPTNLILFRHLSECKSSLSFLKGMPY